MCGWDVKEWVALITVPGENGKADIICTDIIPSPHSSFHCLVPSGMTSILTSWLI